MINLWLLFVLLALLQLINATLLLWSNKNIEIPSLRYFNDKDLENLLTKLESPQIIAFQNDYGTVDNIPQKLENLFSAYVPNGDMYIENVTGLTQNAEENLKMLEEAVKSYASNLKNILIIISSPNIRIKRNSQTAEAIDTVKDRSQNGPVLYDGNGIAMIYSSKPLILRTDTENHTLGNTKKISLTGYGTYSLLVASFPLPKLFITLKFKFQKSWGYWTIPYVQVDGVDPKSIYLKPNKPIRAETNYSYHCFGETIFKHNSMELILYDIQVQPYTKNHRFSEAYDCVPFTTIPIWSGLMVSFTLILGLFLGFSALASIKTMDKFDNSKTKQLSFTVVE